MRTMKMLLSFLLAWASSAPVPLSQDEAPFGLGITGCPPHAGEPCAEQRVPGRVAREPLVGVCPVEYSASLASPRHRGLRGRRGRLARSVEGDAVMQGVLAVDGCAAARSLEVVDAAVRR